MPTLLYILLALPAGGWHGAIELASTPVPGRCEAISHQLELAPSTGMTYQCQTLVLPAGTSAATRP